MLVRILVKLPGEEACERTISKSDPFSDLIETVNGPLGFMQFQNCISANDKNGFIKSIRDLQIIYDDMFLYRNRPVNFIYDDCGRFVKGTACFIAYDDGEHDESGTFRDLSDNEIEYIKRWLKHHTP